MPPPPRAHPPLPAAAREVYLASRPTGAISPSQNFGTRTAALPAAPLPPSTALVRALYVSVDPAMRGWMSDARSYVRPVAIGERMRAAGVAEVVGAGAGAGFSVGDLVTGMTGWCEYALLPAAQLTRIEVPAGLPVSSALGVLGGTGLTAYFGLLEVGRAAPGCTVVVSAAAGATGSVAAQLAKKVLGCYVVGIAGGADKCRYLTAELGLDAAVDYKAAGGVDGGLKKGLAGREVDVFFDSVGGEVLEAGLRRLGRGGRVVLCGAIAAYNAEGGAVGPGPRNYMRLLVARGRMEGFLVSDYAGRFGEARARLAAWVRDGKVCAREVVHDGLEAAPEALCGLFRGENVGKSVVRVGESWFGHDGPRGRL